MPECKTIACVNQKGGVGKSVTSTNLGVGLARHGKKVLIVDCDSQASQTVSLGWREDDLPVTLATLFALQLERKPCDPREAILTQDSLVSLAALDKDGRGRFEGELPFAKYYVMELQTAVGFILDSKKYPVDASYTGEDKAVTKIAVNGGEAIVNKRALGELRILKIDAKTHEPLPGAKFGLYQGDQKIGEAVTDKDGYALFKDLPYGEYQVKELAAPEGYILDRGNLHGFRQRARPEDSAGGAQSGAARRA